MANYRRHDCYKCGNEKCNDEFSEFIPSFYASGAGIVECENFRPVHQQANTEETLDLQ